MHFMDRMDFARIKQDAFRQRRFTRINMGGNANIS
jgi:hypothetical protein